ncbi:unnamed protein product [Caenorhabditis nigoni]
MAPQSKRKRASQQNGDSIYSNLEKLIDAKTKEKDETMRTINSLIVVTTSIRKEISLALGKLSEIVSSKNKEIDNIRGKIEKTVFEKDRLIAQKHWMTQQHHLEIKKFENQKAKLDESVKKLEEFKKSEFRVTSFDRIRDRKSKIKRCEYVIQLIRNVVGDDNVDEFLHFFFTFLNDSPIYTMRYKLTPAETYYVKVRFNLSDGFFRSFKCFLNHVTKYDIFASRHELIRIQREISANSQYEVISQNIVTKCINGSELVFKRPLGRIINLENVLSRRLSTLAKNGRLKFDRATGSDIMVAIGGDKGGEETKIMLVIENLETPNDPNGLLLLGFYTGSDDFETMRINFGSVFNQFNKLDNISYNDGKDLVTKRVHRKVVGDIKWISAVLGHPGQASKRPCYKCDTTYSTHGANKALLSNTPFEIPGKLLRKNDFPKALVNVDPDDVSIPPLHCTTTLVQKYAIDYLIGEANRLDCVEEIPQNLTDQKRALKLLESEESTYVRRISNLNETKESLLDIGKFYQKLNMKSKKKHMRPMCDSAYCLINTATAKSVDKFNLLQCDSCETVIHSYCAASVSNEHKENMRRQTTGSDCFECQLGRPLTLNERIDEVKMRIETVERELQDDETTWSEIQNEKKELKNIVIDARGGVRGELNEAMKSIKCETYTSSKTLTGNMCRRFLRKDNIDLVFSIFEENQKFATNSSQLDRLKTVKAFLYALSELMSNSDNSLKSLAEIADIENNIDDIIKNVREAHPMNGVIVKLHLVTAHLPQFLQQHLSWGRVCEQGIENFHSIFKRIHLKLAAIRDPITKGYCIIQHYTDLNILYDTGEWWNV